MRRRVGGARRRVISVWVSAAAMACAALSTAVFGWPAGVTAHEIPADVTAYVFVKPDGARVRILVRVPLEAMRDMDFPLDGDYLDLSRAGPVLRDAAILWIADEMRLFEDGQPLPAPEVVAARASIPTDRSFSDYQAALDHVLGPPLQDQTWLVWQQALLDVMLEVPVRSEASALSFQPGLGRLGVRVVTVLRFLPPGGTERALQLTGDPGVVRLDPQWHQAAWSFIRLGFEHILSGMDHLLFLLCLIVPMRRLRPLLLVVTAFTLAHSATLVASAYGMAPHVLWFPPLVEALIAASILYMALANIVGASNHHRWAIAFGFGLVHGFGFSFALQESLQFAGRHLLVSLLSFNVGVELGQVLVLGGLVLALNGLFRFAVGERVGVLVISALVAHTAWHWMAERFGVLRAFELEWADIRTAVMGSGLRWMLATLILAALVWASVRRFGLARVHRSGEVPVAVEE